MRSHTAEGSSCVIQIIVCNTETVQSLSLSVSIKSLSAFLAIDFVNVLNCQCTTKLCLVLKKIFFLSFLSQRLVSSTLFYFKFNVLLTIYQIA